LEGIESHFIKIRIDRPYNEANYEAILFKTSDRGLSFKKSLLDKGTLEKIVYDSQKNLYLIKKIYKTDDNSKKYRLLKSTDVGKNWQELNSFEANKIINVQFFDDNGILCLDVGVSKPKLLKTEDGGKTWQEFKLEITGLDTYNMVFLNKNELYTYYTKNNIKQTVGINFIDDEVNIYNDGLPENYNFSNFFRDDVNGNIYSYAYTPKEVLNLLLYNHTTQKATFCDFENKYGQIILGVNVSENFIGVLRNENGKTFYYYSEDDGKNWIKEDLPDYLTDGRPVALYGKGLVWVKSIQNLYHLQVRSEN